MAFVSYSQRRMSRFNSTLSLDFLEKYEDFRDAKLAEERSRVPSKCFAPSSFRCKRKSWFRLRGTEPDPSFQIDSQLEFTAKLGEFIHKHVQANLQELYGEQWANVEDYLSTMYDPDCFEVEHSEYETKVFLSEVPIKFSVDGLLNIDGEYVVIEIKSVERSTFEGLTEQRKQDEDQAICYCTFLNVSKVLFIYVDRQFGNMKCYEFNVKDYQIQAVKDNIASIKKDVELNIPSERLPKGDKWCGMCVYKQRCNQWG